MASTTRYTAVDLIHSASAEDGGFFIDHVTSRIWSASPPTPHTLEEAAGFCAALDAGPGSKYRLPTRIELVTLLEPSLDPPHNSTFTDTQAGIYWTASNVIGDGVTANNIFWVINFDTGQVTTTTYTGTEEAFVRCVID